MYEPMGFYGEEEFDPVFFSDWEGMICIAGELVPPENESEYDSLFEWLKE